MTVSSIALEHLSIAWPVLWPMLEPALLVGADEKKPDVRALIANGHAQLWAVIENGAPVAAVVTEITLEPEKRCRLWLVGGTRMKEWALAFIEAIEPWARAWGCKAIWGTQNRKGWTRIVKLMGGEQIYAADGAAVWARRL